MLERYIAHPKHGTVHHRAAGDARPSPTIRVRGAPPKITDEELATFIQEIAWHPKGLWIREGDSMWGSVTSWPSLIAQAIERGVELPACALKDRLGLVRSEWSRAVGMIRLYQNRGEEVPPELIAKADELSAEGKRLEEEVKKQ